MVTRVPGQIKPKIMRAFRMGQRDAGRRIPCEPGQSTVEERDAYARGHHTIWPSGGSAPILGLNFYPAGGAI